jgi:hypothetical protein
MMGQYLIFFKKFKIQSIKAERRQGPFFGIR